MAALPSLKKLPVPLMCQVGPGFDPTKPPAAIVVPFISQMATEPVVFWSRRFAPGIGCGGGGSGGGGAGAVSVTTVLSVVAGLVSFVRLTSSSIFVLTDVTPLGSGAGMKVRLSSSDDRVAGSAAESV